MYKSEILAPAGDWKSFVVAVEAGADAVYFGGKDFSARSFATNLAHDEIKKAINYAHLRGVKCYMAVNTLIKDKEFVALFDYINFLYEEGVDALIIQDLGVYGFCKKYFSDLPLHASTQMSAHNLQDVLRLEKMGFKRVVLARELSLEEAKEIKQKCKIEIEYFVHGALCFSYSGQCLFSSMIGGRSGNRGKCAQPCRKRYSLIEINSGKNLNIEGYMFSTKDLCSLDLFEKMNFIDSLKIEGRMKSAAYVGGVVQKYRKMMESVANNEKISQEELAVDKNELAAIFNRGGFSHGYLNERKPKNLISLERSKNCGVLVGEVIELRFGAVKIRAENVSVNDGLEIWGRDGQEKNIGFRVERISDGVINIFTEGDVQIGDKVYKNYDSALNKKLEVLSRENYQRKIPVKIIFRAKEGEDISLEMNGVKVEGTKAFSAIKIEISEDIIRKQLKKLGSTPFFAEKIEIEIIGKVYILLKDLNSLRRDVVSKLEKEVIDSFKRPKKEEVADAEIVSNIALRSGIKKEQNGQFRVAIQSNDLATIDVLIDKKISRIYTSLKIDVEKFHKNNIEIYQVLPRIFREGEKVEIFKNYDGFLVPALGYLETLPPQEKKVGDFSLNIFNSYSASKLNNFGFSGFTTSLENTLEEINNLKEIGIEKEVVVYGFLSLMLSEHCVLHGTQYCGQRKMAIGIKDEIGKVFPISLDCVNCRMQLLNSVPLYFTDIKKLKADNIRIIQTIESSEKFLRIVDNYLSGNFGFVGNTTTGHFNREVE